MVTYYNKKDLIAFGKFLLSEKRTKSFSDSHVKNDSTSLEERLREVYHSDIENFLATLKRPDYKISKEEALEKLKKGEIQFLNDTHDSELFCYLTKVNFNGFNYYYMRNDYCGSPFKDIPMFRLSDIF